MASPTFSISAIVLKRTKLGESDVIVTLLAEDGSQYKAVAKGARKPTSTFASRLELFSEATLLLAKGRSLDIVKEVRLVDGHASLRSDYFLSTAAAPIVDLLTKATFAQQPTEKLYALTSKALSSLEQAKNDPLIITAAFMLKALSFMGFKPSFNICINCGTEIDFAKEGKQRFTYYDGGAVCDSCSAFHETTIVDNKLLAWCNALLYSTFDDVLAFQIDSATLIALLRIVSEWISIHLGFGLKSLTFIFKTQLI